MNFLEEIDNYIKKVKEEEFNDLTIYFKRILNSKSIDGYKKVDINSLIKNHVLCELYKYGDDALINGAKKLENINFRDAYEAFKNYGFPPTLKCMDLNMINGSDMLAFETDYHGVFSFLGINEQYKENDTEEEKKKIIKSYEKKLKIKFIEDVLEKYFTDDIFPEDYDKKEDLFNHILNCFYEKYDLDVSDDLLMDLQKKYPIVNRGLIRAISKHTLRTKHLSYSINETNYFLSEIFEKKKRFNNNRKLIIRKLTNIRSYLENDDINMDIIDKIDFNLLYKVSVKMCYYIFSKILSNQKERYENLKNENTLLLKMKNADKLRELFKKFNINYNNFTEDVRFLLSNTSNLNNLELNMKYLNIDETDVISLELMCFLINTPSKMVKEASYYVDRKIVSKDLIIKNLYVFNNSDFIKNCIVMKDNNLSFRHKNYDESILLKENKDLNNNVKLLNLYGRTKNDNNFYYLFDSYYFDLFDFLIEKGCNCDLLDEFNLSKNLVDNFMKRFTICNDLGISIYANGKINTNFLLGNNFYVKDDELDFYICDSNYCDKELYSFIKNNNRNKINCNINELEQFNNLERFKSRDEMFYDIDGIIISRLKVIRNLSLFYENNMISKETILASIIYNSYLDDHSVEIIKKNIFKPAKIKKK